MSTTVARNSPDPRNRVFVVYLDTFGTSPEGAKEDVTRRREGVEQAAKAI